uniref:MIF4G domain-containing protein n=1 Tax=Globisporangium ultimum (strain ATCC 200006 / CBS 805.95 / DAOM BR144) TaxID=431595 RepID=K3WFH0_GLOUD
MSRLNPNAGEFVPSFGPVSVATSAPSVAAPVSALSHAFSSTASSAVNTSSTPASIITTTLLSGEEADPMALGDGNDSMTYSVEFLLKFQSICDTPLPGIPDVVRAPPPAKRLGSKVNGRIVYSVQEMLQFQPLYQTLPADIAWSEILVSGAEAEKKSKAAAKANKQKEKNKQRGQMQLQYDPSLVCYFNPNEYAAAMGLYTGPATGSDGVGAAGMNGGAGEFGNGKVAVVNPIEEAVIAKRRLATLLDDVGPETISSIVESFQEITITCTHTLQEVIGLLFDHAIADPALCDSYAQLCASISEKTPEFKEGAKTINFRRILLTRCYEALVEEPEAPQQQQQHGQSNSKNKSSSGSSSGQAQHSWRRRCMLRNVRLIGELFRRQLLTENVMHVCVAMMLDDEVKPQVEIIEAACELIALVGDLLDGSSPASRRTMDEYFAVLHRLQQNVHLPASVKNTIVDLVMP